MSHIPIGSWVRIQGLANSARLMEYLPEGRVRLMGLEGDTFWSSHDKLTLVTSVLGGDGGQAVAAFPSGTTSGATGGTVMLISVALILATLGRTFGGVVIRAIMRAMGWAGSTGGARIIRPAMRTNWPGWLKGALATMGLAETADLIVDWTSDSLAGLLEGPTEPEGTTTLVPGGPTGLAGLPGAAPLVAVSVLGSWVANGVTFYRLSDGRMAVQNKRGRWKVWRPRKPIVLFADGASNLKQLIRADAVLNRQAQKLAKMLQRRGQKRTSRAKSGPVVVETGPGGVTVHERR